MSLPRLPYYGRRRYGALRKTASSGSNLLRPLPRPESQPALHRPNETLILLIKQAAVRAACNSGVDAAGEECHTEPFDRQYQPIEANLKWYYSFYSDYGFEI